MNADWVFDLTLYVLMFMSFMTWTIAILKTIQFRRASGALVAYDRWVSQQADWHTLVHEGNTKNGADGVVLVQSAVDLSREYAGEAKAHYSFEQLQELMTRDLRQKLGLVAITGELVECLGKYRLDSAVSWPVWHSLGHHAGIGGDRR